jgi:lipopolysaccharide exporter
LSPALRQSKTSWRSGKPEIPKPARIWHSVEFLFKGPVSSNLMSKTLLQVLSFGSRGAAQGKGIKARTLRGGIWIGGASAFAHGSKFARNIILTRLLAPEAFGLMALLVAISAYFETFTEVGIDAAILQNPRSEERAYLNGAWWISMARALGLYAVGFICAPWVANFYHQPSLITLIRVAFLTILFRGAVSPRTYVAHKKMDFKRVVAIGQGGALCGVVTSVLLALVMRNVWALVIGLVAESLGGCIVSYLLCPFRPGLVFDRQLLRELYQYSRGFFGLPLLTFIYQRADIFVVGKMFSPTVLGIYGMAVNLGRMPLSLAGSPMGQLVTPALSEIQDDKERLKNTILKITFGLALLISSAVMYVCLYGRDLLLLVYGTVYAQGAAPMALAFASAMLGVVSVPVVSLFYMTGRPQLNRYFAIVRAVLFMALIYPLTKWYGITGTAAAGLVAMGVAFIVQMFRLRDIIQLDLRLYVKAFARGVPFSLPVAAIWFATHDRFGLGPLAQVALGGAGCLLSFALTLPALAGLLANKPVSTKHPAPEFGSLSD